MKGLTLTQPWASLMALGEKRIETRSWSTNYRGPVAIHAAKGLADPIHNEDGLRYQIALHPFGEALGRHGITVAEQLPRGAVLGIAYLYACLPTRELGRRMQELLELADFEPAEFERVFGNYDPGRYAWFFRDLAPFDEPVPYRGAQGLWEVPEDEYWVPIPITQNERSTHVH